MIDYIKGTVAELTPTNVVVETGGVGFDINISIPTYSALQQKKETKIYVYEVIREDVFQIYGFLHQAERQLFLLLISVSGVGANTARVIMSSFTVPEIKQMIATGDVRALNSIKGIGSKTAQRIIVDLKDKILKIDDMDTAGLTTAKVSPIAESAVRSETLAALNMLGYSLAASQKVVDKIVRENPELTVEQVIKSALKML